MLKKLFPHPILSLALWFIWLLLNNSASSGQMVLGALLATFIPWFTAAFWQEQVRIHRPWLLFKFVGVVIYEILVANMVVARLILAHQNKLQPGFLTVPLDLQSPLAISLLANTISLTPGTVTCDLSEDRQSLLIHALHIQDAEATISDIKHRFEQPLKEIFD